MKMGIDPENNASPATTVTAGGTALGNELLPPEGNHTMATVAGLDYNTSVVDEHGERPFKDREKLRFMRAVW